MTTHNNDTNSSGSNTEQCVACDLTAIPSAERASHRALGKSLLHSGLGVATDIDGGVEYSLPADRLADVARFVEHERLCCAHLRFAIEIPAHRANITLRVTGPLAREELAALA